MNDTVPIPTESNCEHCKGLEGDVCYPQYGVAPHTCYHKIPGAVIGQSVILPKEEWPDNFIADPDNPNCGIWYCPVCKSGMPDADGIRAIERRAVTNSTILLEKTELKSAASINILKGRIHRDKDIEG